jgi:undecaprenyl phosphate-alpha-L-ara4N flippase subunit ArnF
MNTLVARYVHVSFAAASIVLSAAGQLGMKAGMHALANPEGLPAPDHWLTSGAVLWTVAGLACYGLSMLAWLAALTRYALSLMYPLLGLSYVLVYLGATHWSVLMEPASAQRSLGTLLIAVGVAIVSASGHRKSAPISED